MTAEVEVMADLEQMLPEAKARVTASGDVRRRPTPHPITYNNTLGRMVQKMAPTTEGDPIAVLGTLIGGVSAAIGPDVRMPVADEDHPLLAWFLLCGPTAAGRKGTAASVAMRLLSGAVPHFCAENVVSGSSSAEGLIASVADPDEEGVGGVLDKRRLVLENEYAVVLSRAKREGNALSAVLREAWDGRDLRVMTKTPLVATRPHIAMVGHISPKELAERVSARDLAGGSYNRFLLLYVERSQLLPNGGGAPAALVAELAAELGVLIERARELTAVRRAPETDSAWADIYYEFTALEDDERLAPWTSRAIPYTLRLAGLYAALNGTANVTAHDLASAAGMVRYSLDSVRYVLRADSEHSDLEQLARMIRAAGFDGMNRSEITHRFSGRRNSKALSEMLRELLALPGYEEIQMESSGGRPATRYRYSGAG